MEKQTKARFMAFLVLANDEKDVATIWIGERLVRAQALGYDTFSNRGNRSSWS
jgi:hypothetical protein